MSAARCMAAGLVLLGLGVPAAQAQSPGQRVRILHIADYHAHALPFYAEDRDGVGGIARLVAYLGPRAQEPDTLVFNGGDMMNRGVPAWSDKYPCVEWAWLNGIVDAMAYGNHDADYGPEQFQRECLASIDYPILSLNTYDRQGNPVFTHQGKTYAVLEAAGLRIGVIAVAGPDFDSLVVPERRAYRDMTFGYRIEAARQAVQALREVEQVNAVVVIGHSHEQDDRVLAQEVPGIDVIFGSHSHVKRALARLPGTDTYYISPYQYGAYVSEVALGFEDGVLQEVSGGLTAMDDSQPEDAALAAQVEAMQAALAADPAYAALFEQIGAAAIGLSTTGKLEGECVLGNLVMDVLREAAGAHLALATASGMREPIAPGPILEEELRMALPYPNQILVFDMSGAEVQALLDYSVSRRGSDFFSQVSGVHIRIVDGKAGHIEVLSDPSDADSAYVPLDPAATYEVATTDFQALIADGYRQHFEGLPMTETGLDLREQVRRYMMDNSPVAARHDGRIVLGPPPLGPPDSGGGCGCRAGARAAGSTAAVGLLVLLAGFLRRRRARLSG